MVNNQGVMLQVALKYIKRGWHIFPCYGIESGQCICGVGIKCGSPGKHPLTKSGFKDASNDQGKIKEWWDKHPAANIGIATGNISGVVVIDIDPRNGGEKSLELLTHKFGDLPVTLKAKTGGGGEHYYFKYDKRVNSKINLGKGIDLQADGKYVIAPPSLHFSGKKYKWSKEYPIAELPDWVFNNQIKAPHTPVIIGDKIQKGTRHKNLVSIAGSMRRKNLSKEAITLALLAENKLKCSPPLEEEEVKRIAEGISKYPIASVNDKKSELLTDVWNTKQLVRKYGSDIRWCPERGAWLVWSGKHWQKDKDGQVERWAKDTISSLSPEGVDQLVFLRHIVGSESLQRITAMIQLAKSEEGVTLSLDNFDKGGFLLNCLNGTVDLKAGALLPHKKEDYLTKMINVAYDPEAKCPLWDKFLSEVFMDKTDLITFMQRAVGYAVTSDTKEQCFFISHGEGSNGKTTFFGRIQNLLGDYAVTVPSGALMNKKSTSISNDIARLNGCRLAISYELEKAHTLNESLVKSLTGGDKIAARFLFQEYFEFVPAFKLFFATNHKPKITGTDLGIWRRIKLIPFDKVFSDSEADRDLSVKLGKEFPGILNWVIQGCLLWQKDGLGNIADIENATRDYRKEEDIIGNFLEERCDKDVDATVSSEDLFEAYKEWAEDYSEKAINRKDFARYLEAKGFEKKQLTFGPAKGRMYWFGLRLRNKDLSKKSREEPGCNG